MTKQTIAGRLIAGLTALGFVEQKRTTHYRVFMGQWGAAPLWCYVGRAGGLRTNRVGKVSDTISASPRFRVRVLDAANTAEAA
jgi:hypothetical protein